MAATHFSGPVVSDSGFTGDLTGNVTGSTKKTPVNVSASGAITIPSVDTTYMITKAGVAALTIADPTAGTHDGLELTFISATAQAHTLDNSAGSGFNGGGAGSDVATFGGAKGDGLTIVAWNGDWYIKPGSEKNITLS